MRTGSRPPVFSSSDSSGRRLNMSTSVPSSFCTRNDMSTEPIASYGVLGRSSCARSCRSYASFSACRSRSSACIPSMSPLLTTLYISGSDAFMLKFFASACRCFMNSSGIGEEPSSFLAELALLSARILAWKPSTSLASRILISSGSFLAMPFLIFWFSSSLIHFIIASG